MSTLVMTISGFGLVLAVLSWFLAPAMWAFLLLAAGRTWAGLSPARIEVDGYHWHYLRGGKGPVLLALHGFGAGSDNWLRIAPGLTRNFHVIAPDLPGFGRSTRKPGSSFDIGSQVQRLHSFLAALDASPTVIAGNSMGGWIAAAYAARYPGSIQGLWLLAPLGVDDSVKSPMLESIARGEGSPFQVENISQFRQRVLEPMFEKLPWFPYPMMVHYTREARKLAPNAPGMFSQVTGNSEALESIAERIRVPVLLQWGDKDHAVDVSGIKALQKTFTTLTVQVQENTGHIPMLETPRASLQFFRHFCRRHQLG